MNKIHLWQKIQSRLDETVEDWQERVMNLGQIESIEDRNQGRSWDDAEIFEGLLLALLSGETVWSRIESIKHDMAEVFYGFNLADYATLEPETVSNFILPWFQERKAGSRGQEKQLKRLILTARKLCEYSTVNGLAESYFTDLFRLYNDDAKAVALALGSDGSEYKLPGFGVALSAEALKNLGFDVAKVDKHVARAAACFQLVKFADSWIGNKDGYGEPAQRDNKKYQLETMKALEDMGNSTGNYSALVDNAIWLLCADKRSGGAHLNNQELRNLAETC